MLAYGSLAAAKGPGRAGRQVNSIFAIRSSEPMLRRGAASIMRKGSPTGAMALTGGSRPENDH
jgi:hypothetical protein